MGMSPRYSILFCNQSLAMYKDRIAEWLHSGIKVIWFGTSEDVNQLKNTHTEFAKEFLLQAYVVDFYYKNIIYDGQDKDGFLNILEKECPQFNVAQYKVEHCKEDEHIVVQASAGTGKTKVMVDRIMFLMHTVPDLQMSDIFMITFTNDATNQMNQRLQDALMTRFRLTGNLRYFRWVEEQSQMNISTIHSFAYTMLKEYGIGQSFTRNLSIRNFKYERKDLIKDMMDVKTDDTSSIRSQVGVPLYKANALVDKYWNGFASIGISHKDMSFMDWGKPADEVSAPFHNLISSVVEDLDDDYFEIKRLNDAISVNDIMRDLQEVLMSDTLPQPDMSMKYLFIDEFQDSDLSQIKVATLLVKLMGAKLFVVGDVKQSIYRFRGATDQAFDILYRDLKEVGAKPTKNFILVNNYRTAANIMNRMNKYFEQWGRDGLLKYDGPVVPFNQEKGLMKMIPGYRDQELENELIIETARQQLDELIDKVEKSGKKPTEKNRVVMLTRTNSELKNLADLLRRSKIPASVSQDGSFFTSEAVRDFYTMICSYMFADEPKHVFNYLFTPYAGEIEPMDINLMEQYDGNSDMLIEYLSHFLKQTTWEKYYKEFRLRPVMSVIKNIIDFEPILDNFIVNSKRRKMDAGWDEKRAIAATRTEAIKYQANLEKLQIMLQQNMGGDKVSLYDVYHYLKLQIATNRTDSEPNVETEDDYSSILCMTVHKSKGLEFDTIIVPYTGRRFPDRYNTEIIIDPLTKEVGWNFEADKNNPDMRNDLYPKLKNIDIYRTKAEETRILYVAMTRAINNLICIVHPSRSTETWGYLIEEVGVDYE